MRALIPIIEVVTLTMFYAWQYLTLGRAVALEFSRNADTRTWVHLILERSSPG